MNQKSSVAQTPKSARQALTSDTSIAERPGTLRAEFESFDHLASVLVNAGLGFLPDFAAPESQQSFAEARHPEDMKEAARKLYVALTRARDRLILVLPKERRTARTQPERMIDILRDHAGLMVNDGEISLCGRAFEARIFDGNVERPYFAGIIENVGYALFGERPVLSLTGKTAWGRSPSTFANPIDEPASHLTTYSLGSPISDRALADPAARGTAWHLALRVLVQHPDKANQLAAATGLPKDTLGEIEAQARALTSWLSDQGFDRSYFELPIQEVAADGSETNAIIDLLAEGQNGLLIVDYKSGACPDPEARYATYLPQI